MYISCYIVDDICCVPKGWSRLIQLSERYRFRFLGWLDHTWQKKICSVWHIFIYL